MALQRGSDHLAWGGGCHWRVQECFLEYVNIMTSQVENLGEYVRKKEQQECTHFLVEGTAT